MVEIKSLEQANALNEGFFTPPEDIGGRANQITELLMAGKRNGTSPDHECPHFGGDFWLHFGLPHLNHFCNIPPGPGSFNHSAPTQEQVLGAVTGFLEDRNLYLGNAVDYFSNRTEE